MQILMTFTMHSMIDMFETNNLCVRSGRMATSHMKETLLWALMIK